MVARVRQGQNVVVATVRQHLDELLKLPAEERSEVAEALLASLEAEPPEPDVERAWAEELRRRAADDAPGIPAETVFAAIRARLTKP